MEKILAIIKREYLQRVRTRAFLITTIAAPLIMLGLTVLPILLASRGGATTHIIVLDQSGDTRLYDIMKKKLESSTSGSHTTAEQVVVPRGDDIDAVEKSYEPRIADQENAALIVLPPGILDEAQPGYYSKSINFLSVQEIGHSVSAAVTESRFAKAGFDSGKIDQYMQSVDIKTFRIGAGGTSAEDSGVNFIVGYVMLFAIYITVLLYGMMIMRSVIEEKQSRVVEVLVSSVRPFQMMMGKLLGVGMVALTQIAIWVASVMIITTLGATVFARGTQLPHIAPGLYAYFVGYFVLGYFLFATLYAMIGSTVSSEDEGQQAQIPVTALLVIPVALFSIVLRDPNGSTSVILSMIPFFAPTLMMLRIAIASPPLWQPLLSIVIMIVTIVAAVWVAARVYRIGILMYGKKPSIAELGRWIRYSTN
jgi:ABC-2 type transport system permease protein